MREGGITGERYRALRPYNHFVTQFGDLLADSDPVADHGVLADPDVRLVVRQTPAGRLLFVTCSDERPRLSLTLPGGGQMLDVHFDGIPAAVLPLGLEVWPGLTVDGANVNLMLRDTARRLLVLHGTAGSEAVVILNGKTHRLAIARHGVHRLDIGDATVLVLDTAMARRCWPDNGELVIGPDYLYERKAGGRLAARVGPSTPGVVVCSGAHAEPRVVKFDTPLKMPPLPELAPWRQLTCGEIVGGGEGWTMIDAPKYHDELGVPHGYIWFHAEAQVESAGIHSLLIPAAASPVLVYANGQFAATVGEHRSVNQRMGYSHPSRRLQEAVAVPLKAGRNELLLLAEDSGDTLFVPSTVGIRGPVFLDARAFEPRFEVEKDGGGPILAFDLPLAGGELAVLQMLQTPWRITIDGEPLAELSHPRDFFHGFLLPVSKKDAVRRVRMHHQEGGHTGLLNSLSVNTAPLAGQLQRWAWKPFDERPDFSVGGNAVAAIVAPGVDKPMLLVPTPVEPGSAVRSFQPRWFATSFARPTTNRPVFFQPGSMHKGQIYLNGRNVGRFWMKRATQTHYYLPEPWLRDRNELLIFEEQGLPPVGAALSWKEGGPWGVIES